VTPAGYIELNDGRSHFVLIVKPARMALAGLATMNLCAAAIGVHLPRRSPRRRLGPPWR
jgi:hypothetical protein